MKMWIIQSNEPVEGVYRTRANQQDQQAPHLTALWDRDLLEWAISSSGEIREQMEHHQDMLRYHRGDKVFWFDGGISQDIHFPRFIGYGNGMDTDFFLPDRFVYPESLVMSVDYTTVTAWTLTSSTGMLRFTAAPAEGALIQAEKYKRRFKGYIKIGSDDRLYSLSDNFKSFSTKDIMIGEFPY